MNSFEKNKSILAIGLTMLLLLCAGGALGFFGMGFVQKHRMQEQEAIAAAVTEDVEGFCEALGSGDIATAKLYCSEQAAAQMGLDMMDAGQFRQLLMEGLSLKDEDMTDDLRQSFDTFIAILSVNVVTDVTYDINELAVTENGRHSVKATLPVKLTGIGGLASLDFGGEIALANVTLANYTMENQKTLMDLFDKNGEEAVKSNLMQHELGSLFSSMNAKAKEAAADEHEWELTFVIGKDGRGRITSATIDQAVAKKAASEENADEPQEEK